MRSPASCLVPAARSPKRSGGLTGVPLTYVSSGTFVTGGGDPLVNVVFVAPIPVDAQPLAASPDEVVGVVWLSVADALADRNCPPRAQRSLRQAAAR
jgi:hypothetical protein